MTLIRASSSPPGRGTASAAKANTPLPPCSVNRLKLTLGDERTAGQEMGLSRSGTGPLLSGASDVRMRALLTTPDSANSTVTDSLPVCGERLPRDPSARSAPERHPSQACALLSLGSPGIPASGKGPLFLKTERVDQPVTVALRSVKANELLLLSPFELPACIPAAPRRMELTLCSVPALPGQLHSNWAPVAGRTAQ